MDDLISRQAAIDALAIGEELLKRVLDDLDVVGNEREKYKWGLGLIESYIADMKDLPSAHPEQRWIPVTERLPLVTYDEHGNHSSEPVILCMESGEIEIGFFNPVGTFESADDDGLSVIGSIHAGTVDYKHVVAWMPFPEPYERSENDS